LVLKRTMDLLPDAENNIRLLRGISAKSASRLVSLATEWEKHRAPLIEEYRKERLNVLNKKDDSMQKLNKIREMVKERKKNCRGSQY